MTQTPDPEIRARIDRLIEKDRDILNALAPNDGGMTPHNHSKRVPGCYRCELGEEEARDASGYVNAIITLVIPLEDITPDEPHMDKLGAAVLCFDDLADKLGERWMADVVGTVKYEDVTSDE